MKITFVQFLDKSIASLEKVKTDTFGWIQPKALHIGYAYFSYESVTGGMVILAGIRHEMVYNNGIPSAGNRCRYKITFISES